VTRKLFSEVCFAIDFVVGVTQLGVEIALLLLCRKLAVASKVFGLLVIVILTLAGVARDYGNVVFMVDLNKAETLWNNWGADIAFTRWDSTRSNERVDCLVGPTTMSLTAYADKLDVSGVVDERVVMVLEVVVDALPTRLARCWCLCWAGACRGALGTRRGAAGARGTMAIATGVWRGIVWDSFQILKFFDLDWNTRATNFLKCSKYPLPPF
jgi:hypothetical protein